MLGDSSCEIVIGNFSCHAAQRNESMDMATDESLKALAVSELQIEHAAVGLNQGKGIEFARVAGILQCTKVSPIDFKTLTGCGLHADKGAGRLGLRADFPQILTQDAVAAGI